jgi:hypothetical protein
MALSPTGTNRRFRTHAQRTQDRRRGASPPARRRSNALASGPRRPVAKPSDTSRRAELRRPLRCSREGLYDRPSGQLAVRRRTVWRTARVCVPTKAWSIPAVRPVFACGSRQMLRSAVGGVAALPTARQNVTASAGRTGFQELVSGMLSRTIFLLVKNKATCSERSRVPPAAARVPCLAAVQSRRPPLHS